VRLARIGKKVRWFTTESTENTEVRKEEGVRDRREPTVFLCPVRLCDLCGEIAN
jgi:hypothetical protein